VRDRRLGYRLGDEEPGVSFRHAVELLRNEHPSSAEPVRIVAKGITEAVPFEVNADDQRGGVRWSIITTRR
jgi:hypothetical protein